MHRLFGFFTTTEFLFGARYKDLIVEAQWNAQYFSNYLANLGHQLSREFEEWRKLQQQPQQQPTDSSSDELPKIVINPSFERRRSLNPDEATLSTQTNSSSGTGTQPVRRRSLFDQMASMVSPRSSSRSRPTSPSTQNQSIQEEGKEKEES